MPDLPLRVVGPRWMAADLGGIHDYGTDVPEAPCAFWCSGAHLARLQASGFPIRFSTPGGMVPVAALPAALRSRRIITGTADQLSHVASVLKLPVWVKPNDLKLPQLPAVRAGNRDELALAARTFSAGGRDELMLAVSESLELSVEVRHVVLDAQVRCSDVYADGAGRFGREAARALPAPRPAVCAAEAAIAAWQQSGCAMPRAYVIDTALTPAGWIVLETNPVASSGWFSWTPPPVLAEAIRTGQNDEPVFDWSDPADFLVAHPLFGRRSAG